MGSEVGESSHHEESPLLQANGVPLGNSASEASSSTSSSMVSRGRLLLILVALIYGSLSVSLRLVYARPGPPSASVLSATRGWMTVLCLLPLVLIAKNAAPANPSGSSSSSSSHSKISFYGFCLELAIFNFGTQGLLNIGLLTTASARSSFFTQLSVVITPVLAATIARCHKNSNNSAQPTVQGRVWIACGVALVGLIVLSLAGSSDDTAAAGPKATTNGSAFLLLSFGDWCCLGSAFCWSYYIYRLSDWGHRYDEAQTMFAKNVFMAILYTVWAIASYFRAVHEEVADHTETDGFVLWRGWRDPVAITVLFYTALSSGALADILQQKAQASVPAAESNVILSLEPVFAALLGLVLLGEMPSVGECLGGGLVLAASVLAST